MGVNHYYSNYFIIGSTYLLFLLFINGSKLLLFLLFIIESKTFLL